MVGEWVWWDGSWVKFFSTTCIAFSVWCSMLACGKQRPLCSHRRARAMCPLKALCLMLFFHHHLIWGSNMISTRTRLHPPGGSYVQHPELFCKAQLMEQTSTRDSVGGKGDFILYKRGFTPAWSLSNRFCSFVLSYSEAWRCVRTWLVQDYFRWHRGWWRLVI